MNGVLTRAWLVGLMLIAPQIASAQTEPAPSPPATTEPAPEGAPGEAKAEEEKKDEAKPEEKKDEAAPAEVTPAEVPAPTAPSPEKAVEATEAEKAASGMPSTTAAPAATPAPAAAPAAAAATKEGAAEEDEDHHEAAATQLGAAAPVPPDTGRNWQVLGNLEANVGNGSFIADPNARQVAIGWSADVTGFYKITDLFEGRLDAMAVIGWDQVITNNVTNAGTRPSEFFFRDTRLALVGRGLFKEELTGVIFGSSLNAFLPTSKMSQAQERVLRVAVNGTAARMFTEIGPGNILLNFATSLRKDFGSASPVFDQGDSESRFATCRSLNRLEDSSCASNVASMNWGWANTLTATYLWGDFSFAASLGVVSQWAHHLADLSEVPTNLAAGSNLELNRSQYAQNEANYSTLTQSSLSASYQATENFGVYFSVGTLQSPIIQDGPNSSRLKFPFFDFESSANNLSSFALGVSGQY